MKAFQIGKTLRAMALEQVTSNGTGLNPNTGVWQEISHGNTDATPVTHEAESSWHEIAATSGSHPEGNTELSDDMCKEYEDLSYQIYDVSRQKAIQQFL